MRELADEEVALVSGGEEAPVTATAEPAEPAGFFQWLLREIAFIFDSGATSTDAPLQTGTRG